MDLHLHLLWLMFIEEGIMVTMGIMAIMGIMGGTTEGTTEGIIADLLYNHFTSNDMKIDITE